MGEREFQERAGRDRARAAAAAADAPTKVSDAMPRGLSKMELVCPDCREKYTGMAFMLNRPCPACARALNDAENKAERERADAWLTMRLDAIDRTNTTDELFTRQLGVPPRFRTARESDFSSVRFTAFDFSKPAGEKIPLLTFTGDAGVGKTHALWVIAKTETFSAARSFAKDQAAYIFDEEPARKIYWRGHACAAFAFVRVPDLAIELQAAAGADLDRLDKRLKTLREFSGALLLDDLAAEKTTDFIAQCIYTVISAREEWERPTALSTNLGLTAISERYGDRIASRLAGGHVVRMNGDDKRLVGA